MIELLEAIVGAPASLDELKRRPGRRRTLRVRGPRGSAIAKVYASDRAAVVASRVASLASGPPEPVVPAVLLADSGRHLLVLSDVPGSPLREALLAVDLGRCSRAGAALGTWHTAWAGRAPDALARHTAVRELEILDSRAARSSPPVARAIREALRSLAVDWECTTVVHRDLYEEQVLVGEHVGLIDLDDAAIGPPELDLGNLLAHVTLLELRRARDLSAGVGALLGGYAKTGPALDAELLDCCRRLTLLRLACLNDDARLVDVAHEESVRA
jgi:Ser/Thr protein kinase RdoA (MazF antagonist)